MTDHLVIGSDQNAAGAGRAARGEDAATMQAAIELRIFELHHAADGIDDLDAVEIMFKAGIAAGRGDWTIAGDDDRRIGRYRKLALGREIVSGIGDRAAIIIGA